MAMPPADRFDRTLKPAILNCRFADFHMVKEGLIQRWLIFALS
jgi:hypothetical protein